MSDPIGPEHELHAPLMNARITQGGEVVVHGNLYYWHFVDNATHYFALLERKPEKDSIGKESPVHRGWYPPEVRDP